MDTLDLVQHMNQDSVFPADLISGVLYQVSRLLGQRGSTCGIEASHGHASCVPIEAVPMLWPVVDKLRH